MLGLVEFDHISRQMSSEPAEVFYSVDRSSCFMLSTSPHVRAIPIKRCFSSFLPKREHKGLSPGSSTNALILCMYLGDRHGEGGPSVTCLHFQPGQPCCWGPHIYFQEQPRHPSVRASAATWVTLWASLSLVFNLSNACHIQFTLAIRQKR